MKLNEIFSTKERTKILENIIFREKEFGVNEIANKTKLSKGLVSKYLEILSKEKIIRKKKRKYIVENNVFVKSLRILINLQEVDPKLFKKYKFVKAVGIYGSCARGTNTESSDIDLWIKVKKSNQKEIIRLTSELKKKNEKIKPIFLDDNKLNLLKKEDPLFYYSLYFGSILIYGEENEI